MGSRTTTRGRWGTKLAKVLARSVLLVVLPFAVVGALASSAGAINYSVRILVEDVDDLRDLLENGDILEEEYELLARYMDIPLDLRLATSRQLYDLPGITEAMAEKIVRFRKVNGAIEMVDLGDLGIPVSVLQQIRSFVTISKPREKAVPTEPIQVRGVADVKVVSTLAENEFREVKTSVDPDTGEVETEKVRKGEAGALRAYATIDRKYKVGVAGLFQKRLGPFDAHHEDGLTWLSAEPEKHRVQVPKLYGAIDERHWGVILGSYEAGFADRLVFGETDRQRPEGFYPDHAVNESSESARFSPRERLVGFAARLKHLPVGEEGDIDGTIFASWWPYDAFQNDVDSHLRDQDDSIYEGSNPLLCDDSVDPEECALHGVGKMSSEQLRAAYSEGIAGGHVSWSPGPNLRIGTTAYGSKVDWLQTEDLYFVKSANHPDRDTLGAYGIDVEGWMAPDTLITAELARTLEGGNAAFARFQSGFDTFDITTAFRYYDEDFDNPHARGPAKPDQLEGQTDRDELGGQVRVSLYPSKAFDLRLVGDVHHRPTLEVTNAALEGRADYTIAHDYTVGAGVALQDKDISASGRDKDYDDSSKTVDGEEVKIPGQGSKIDAFAQVSAALGKRVGLTLLYKNTWTDSSVADSETDAVKHEVHENYQTAYAHRHYATLTASVRVLDPLVLKARFKFYDDETKYDFRGESYMEGQLAVTWKVLPKLTLNTRFLLRRFVDKRESTLDGRPMDQFLRSTLTWRF